MTVVVVARLAGALALTAVGSAAALVLVVLAPRRDAVDWIAGLWDVDEEGL